MKIRKNPEKIRKADEIPEKKIIISHSRNKPSNLSRNMVKTVKIWKFQKCSHEKWRNKKNLKKTKFNFLNFSASLTKSKKTFWSTTTLDTLLNKASVEVLEEEKKNNLGSEKIEEMKNEKRFFYSPLVTIFRHAKASNISCYHKITLGN